ncbi:MAG TPA: hypothetical protein VMW36_05180 [Patescibacteria group bacterium]|nr:hypothetical protein [Patescibacteria group bacterium]
MRKRVFLDADGIKEVTPEKATYCIEAEYDDKTGKRIWERYSKVVKK